VRCQRSRSGSSAVLREADEPLCGCDWEEEHGLQIVLRNGVRVNKVDGYDGHLTNSDAFADDGPEAKPKRIRFTKRALAALKRASVSPISTESVTVPSVITSPSDLHPTPILEMRRVSQKYHGKWGPSSCLCKSSLS
jgi:hypothetical protein